MLYVYDINTIPKDLKIIKSNDSFFNTHTNLIDDDFGKLVLNHVDKATFASVMSFNGRSSCFGPLNKNNLSTGAKTLLNIYQNPDFCFNVVECGTNARELLPFIKNGNIYTKDYLDIYIRTFNRECSISYRNKEFYNTIDFMEFYKEMYELEHPDDF